MDKIFWDTSGIKALVDEKDLFFGQASSNWKKLVKNKSEIYLSNFIVDETYTLLRKKCGMKTVKSFRDYLLEMVDKVKIERVKIIDEIKAWQWFDNDWSDLSFTDCVSFAMMKRLGIKKVFGFDQHFKRAGFELVGEKRWQVPARRGR